MATTMQKEILTALELRFEADHFVTQLEYEYSNCGIIRAVPEGQFTSEFPMHFDFQKQYCNFKYSPSARNAKVKHSIGVFIDYNQGEANFTSKLEKIVQFLENGEGRGDRA